MILGPPEPFSGASSSKPTERHAADAQAHRQPPARIPVPLAPPPPPAADKADTQPEAAHDSAEGLQSSPFAGGCCIGARTAREGEARAAQESARGSAQELQDEARASDEARALLAQLVRAKGGDPEALLALGHDSEGSRAELLRLGFTKVGERMKVEMALRRCVSTREV